MRKNCWRIITAMLLLVVLAAGCSDEIDKAIKNLGGTEQERKEAMDIIAVSAKDPMPKLIKALSNKSLSPLAREKVAELIGSTAAKNGDMTVIADLVAALDKSEDTVQVAILKSIDKIPGDESTKAIQKLLDSKNASVAKAAWDLLDQKAKEKIASADALDGDASLQRKTEILEEAQKINPRNQEVTNKLASTYALTGNTEKAKELQTAGGSYVSSIKVIGPFPGDANKDFIDAKTFRAGAPVTLPDGTPRQWFAFNSIPDNGIIDFRKNRQTKKSKSIYYAAFNINAQTDKKVMLKVYSKSGIKISLGGETVFDADVKTARSKPEHEVEVSVKKGMTPILVKVRDRKYARFAIRVSGTDRLKISDVGFSL